MQSLKGQLLVAGPSLLDPNFRRTVVLVGEHTDEGALGVVLNRASEATVEDAVPELSALIDDEELVHVGGPVQPSAIVVVADFADPEQAGALILDSVGFLPAEVDPDAIGELRRARVFAGYAGWGPGQLDEELDEGSWIVAPALAEDVFTGDPEELWSEVLRRKGGPFEVLALMPPDPSAN
ncbi:MAG TPA: YqgE/AlgH family protein [Gaiellaceae bacterium]|jgi:putative transcriptional regulator|nr:YqgE/AlgH family protein [Gaiellaceae bacterium]